MRRDSYNRPGGWSVAGILLVAVAAQTSTSATPTVSELQEVRRRVGAKFAGTAEEAPLPVGSHVIANIMTTGLPITVNEKPSSAVCIYERL